MRPIDADVLVSDIESARNMFFHSPYERMSHEDRIEFALNMVEDVPTLDYAPIRHGEWVTKPDGFIPADIYCSECGKRYNFFYNPNYCPNCGARMDGKDGT